jgi:hypothetical protein
MREKNKENPFARFSDSVAQHPHERTSHARATAQTGTVGDYCGRTFSALMYWFPKLSISYCPFFLSKRILAAAMI